MQKRFIRLIAVVLTMLICFSAGSLSAFAADSAAKMSVVVEPVTAKPGDTVQVNINLRNNPGITSLKLLVHYDQYVTLKSVSFNSAFGAYVTAPEPYRNPQPLNMISPLNEISANGNFATLTFAVSQNAPANHYSDITLSYDPDDIFDGDYDNVDTKIVNGYIKIAGGISPKEGTNTVVDDENKYIYGLDPNFKNIKDYIDYSSDDVRTVPTSNGLGTGTLVQTIVNGEVEETYTVIIYGDVNGDGKYDGRDAVKVDCIVKGSLTEKNIGKAAYLAADCNNDGEIDNTDVDILNRAGALLAQIDQSKPKEEQMRTDAYQEYINLIDQTPEKQSDDNQEETNRNFFQKIGDFFRKIINWLKSVVRKVTSK